MSFDWKNKTVIISGSSAGLGKTLAFETGKKGACIVLNGRNKEKLEKTADELSANGIEVISAPGDISKYSDCENIAEVALKKFGQIDILINNAALASYADFSDLEIGVLENVVNVNLLGTVNMTKAVLPNLLKTKGSIVFIGSVAGIHGVGGYAPYSMTKMALTSFAESLKIELSDTGVHVGIVYPGFIENDSDKTFFDKDGKLISVPSREGLRKMTTQEVSFKIIRLIERRRFKTVLSTIGKLNAILNRISPRIIHLILRNAYKKQ